jgi:DNA polymerase II small subunit
MIRIQKLEMNPEILKTIRERGLLLEKDIFDLLNGFNDAGFAKDLLEGLERFSGQKIITKSAITKNFEYVQNLVNKLPGENKSLIEKTFVKLGLSFEIRKEKEIVDKAVIKENKISFQVDCFDTTVNKKLDVGDFVGSFRSRYQQIQRMLMNRPELQQGLVSINKISNNRQGLAIIGIVTEKRITKNRNMIIRFEDLTGEISGVVRAANEETFKKAEELQLDDIVGIKASGNRDLLFVYDIFFPDSFVSQKTKFDEDVCVAFLSDVHAGSKMHLGKNMEKFLEWINSEDETVVKIKYIFFNGDNVDGVGIFPGQEDQLALKSMKEQYALLASYLRKIPSHIKIFMCPGQHDAVRVAEPQPIIDKNYAPLLYEMDNLVLVTNPTMVKLLEKGKEFKILMYHGASIHSLINGIPELREMKAHKTPAKAVKHMLKRRHLAPTHSTVTYIPNADRDPLVISEVPDVLVTGEVHRLDIENYNGTLIITGSCWQSQTPFEEKVGNETDPCKVPVLNLKTRELKIFDFSDKKEDEPNEQLVGEEMQ